MGKQQTSREGDVSKPQETMCMKTEMWGLVSDAGNTAVQLFVSVLRLVLRLGGLRAIHQTFAEVPSSLRELWGIHK